MPIPFPSILKAISQLLASLKSQDVLTTDVAVKLEAANSLDIQSKTSLILFKQSIATEIEIGIQFFVVLVLMDIRIWSAFILCIF